MVEVHIPETSTLCTFPKIGQQAFFTIGRQAKLFKESSTMAFCESEIDFWWTWILVNYVCDQNLPPPLGEKGDHNICDMQSHSATVVILVGLLVKNYSSQAISGHILNKS